jgi:hypothetical protein
MVGTPKPGFAGTAGYRLNFLATRLKGTENPPKRPAIWRMSAKTTSKLANIG